MRNDILLSETSSILPILRIHRFANSLTLFRAALSVPILLNLQYQHKGWAWTLIMLGGITDVADGALTRRAGISSTWGARIDPLADKLLVLAPLIWLAHQGVFPCYAIWILLARELLISAWRSNKSDGGPASSMGKYKTSLQFTCLLLLMWPIGKETNIVCLSLHSLGWLLFWPSLILALISGLDYMDSI
uniref:CDP-diacylglycerol-glycerol-3-phosphate 3-phosphatidyltransferase n=1 Tax=Paulinella chromatophora TaxID=39717 RepID=B1X3Q0_PAUCH|nr:CDP-diacylglycerol-glycerol-3-phosphate 3-phosphatidyltransferase [Paulinella chromatophora]ACB42569.1 CDP-diacylglycerol-glycerol-3-phosphate 3-phosphatidyltransferase [Paulinella chromatophora]